MIATNALVGQPIKLPGVSPSVSKPVQAPGPFQLDAGPQAISKPSTATVAPQADRTVVEALSSIAQLITVLATKSKGTPLIDANSKPVANGGPVGGGNGALGVGGGNGAFAAGDGVTVPATFNKTTDPAQKAKLDATLAKIASDPEGSKLLQKAIANGYTIEIGDAAKALGGQNDKEGAAALCPACQAALDAGGTVNGATLPDQKKIVIDPNAENFDKTVVHELVHAATPGDGNSQQEEGLADVLGFRITSRINGTPLPGSERDIFNNKIQNYKELQANNGIDASLAAIGLTGFSSG